MLFLQEINHTPILAHIYAYSLGTKATIALHISQDKNSTLCARYRVLPRDGSVRTTKL